MGGFYRGAQTIQQDGAFNLLAQNAASAELRRAVFEKIVGYEKLCDQRHRRNCRVRALPPCRYWNGSTGGMLSYKYFSGFSAGFQRV